MAPAGRLPAAILDVDGTLVDSNWQHVVAWSLALRSRGVVLPAVDLHRHVGMGGDVLVPAVAGEHVDRRLGDELRGAHDALFAALLLETTEPLPGASALLTELHRRGHAIALASSARRAEVEHHVANLGARDLVDHVITADDAERGKPHPDLVRAALDALGHDDAVMVGDTPWDVEAAGRAGIPCIALLTGGFCAADLLDAGAEEVLATPAELCAALDRTAFGRAGTPAPAA